LLFDTRWLPLTMNHHSGGKAGQHGPHMRLNPRRLGFRDQLAGLFPRLLCALIHHPSSRTTAAILMLLYVFLRIELGFAGAGADMADAHFELNRDNT
jgi:hypothetical protein